MRRGRRLLVTMLGMALISSGTYFMLGRFSTRSSGPARPTASMPVFSLPGTIYLAQHGAIYTVSRGSVGRLNLSTATFWAQPAVSRDGTELVVSGGDSRFTDLFLVSSKGEVVRRLTDNRAREVDQNHWAFFPRFSGDGGSLFYSWDPKIPGNAFRVDLAVFSLDLRNDQPPPGRRWTQPDAFTGGDVQPQPVAGPALLYAGYSAGSDLQIQSRIWWQLKPGVPGTALTDLAANCGSPALSPAGDQLAMICSPSAAKANLVVVPFRDGVLGAPDLTIDDQAAAAPVWSPDGKGVAYLAPGKAGAGFDLWWVPVFPSGTAAASPSPSPAAANGRRQVTMGLDLDATSVPAWSPL